MKAVTGITLVVLPLVGACSSSRVPGDRYFESGRYLEAAAAFEAYLEGEPEDAERMARSMFRLGVSHALPDSPVYQPEKAVDVLTRLLSIDPSGPYSAEARLVRDLLGDALELDLELSRLRHLIDDLTAGHRRLELEMVDARTEAVDRAAQIDDLTVEIEGLIRRIRELSQDLEAREQELERLKAIDLQRPPLEP